MGKKAVVLGAAGGIGQPRECAGLPCSCSCSAALLCPPASPPCTVSGIFTDENHDAYSTVSLLLKQSQVLTDLALFDVVPSVIGVGADLSQ